MQQSVFAFNPDHLLMVNPDHLRMVKRNWRWSGCDATKSGALCRTSIHGAPNACQIRAVESAPTSPEVCHAVGLQAGSDCSEWSRQRPLAPVGSSLGYCDVVARLARVTGRRNDGRECSVAFAESRASFRTQFGGEQGSLVRGRAKSGRERGAGDTPAPLFAVLTALSRCA